MGWLERLGFKEGDDTFTPLHPAGGGLLPLTRLNYGALVRQGLDSNVVMAPVQWIMRAFPEADALVEHKTAKGRPWRHEDEHALEYLLRQPNPGYDGASLFQATALSYTLNGNAYWWKVRNAFGAVIELWYVPHWEMEPLYPIDGSQYIAAYRYTPAHGVPRTLHPDDVVHLRFALDPREVRLGLSPLRALMREVYTDEEAAAFSATILRNMGVPGLLIAPKEAKKIAKEDVEEIRNYVRSSHSGDRRGDAMVMSSPTDVSQFGYDPNRLMLGGLRDIVEERVCAALGIPAAVVGFGAGLQATKVGATMREMRRLAWVQCIIPMQLAIARQLTHQLIADFEPLARRWRIRFDTSTVSAFQEEETEKAARLGKLVDSGILLVADAQEQAGLEVDESQRVYLRPTGRVAVRQGDAGVITRPDPKPPTDPAPPADPPPPPPPAPPKGLTAVLTEARAALASVTPTGRSRRSRSQPRTER